MTTVNSNFFFFRKQSRDLSTTINSGSYSAHYAKEYYKITQYNTGNLGINHSIVARIRMIHGIR